MFKFSWLLLLFFSCTSQNKKEMPIYTNSLIDETSPYLLQHAHNPVQWHAWNEETLALAKKENKLLIISIGYAACHWCHVMEEESFEDLEVAKIMNENFINIKVDREERPDVDQVYMNAVQLMNGQGGWPLNCIALPDGRPVWGGTYFPKDQWLSVLNKITELNKNDPNKIIGYATELTKGIKQSDLITLNTAPQEFTKKGIALTVDKWQQFMDFTRGGTNRAPKFPMPNNYEFLLRYGVQFGDEKIKNYVNTSLEKMAYGGIFDQVGGGFSRYSVDQAWHIPHFEKMLYDNAQLIQVYSQAYRATKNPLFKQTVEQTIAFVERDLMDSQGAFYASLDADSKNAQGELEEGTYYIWPKDELIQLLKDDFKLFSQYYSITDKYLWEQRGYQLFRPLSDEDFAKQNSISLTDLLVKVTQWKKKLLAARNLREHPRLDDKILTSWNAMMLRAYVEAYRTFGTPTYLNSAETLAEFLLTQRRKDGGLWRNYKSNRRTINAYLEDYSAVIDAYISLYQVNLDQKWLTIAKELSQYCFEHFYDKDAGFFYFTSAKDPSLITRKIEVEDNVIPSSNSIMAKNIMKLGMYFGDKNYREIAKNMLHHMQPQLQEYGAGYSNWAQLYMDQLGDYYEIAVVGASAKNKLKKMQSEYIPNAIWIGSEIASSLPLLENKFQAGKTKIFVCIDGSCKLPVSVVEKALSQINITVN